MIDKIIPGDSQEGLVKAAGQMVTVYEHGRNHIKCAASNIFPRAAIERWAPPAGKFASHVITMGSAELYGPNRNHDLWPHEELVAHHGTFETHARNYLEHDNRDPAKAVGEIKEARYDPVLQRGEVIMWTDIDKAASQFERARENKEQSGSMAASVVDDVCTACGFVSKFAHERCSCIRDTPGKYFASKGKYAHMLNHGPLFKDYSWVERPADRIAHVRNYLLPKLKAAAEHAELRGDQLAEALAARYADPDAWRSWLVKIAAFDARQEHPLKLASQTHLFPRAFHGQFEAGTVAKMAAHAWPARILRSLADRQMVMPLPTFDAFVSGRALSVSENDPVVKEASAILPDVRALIIDGAFPDFASAVRELEPSCCACGDEIDTLLDQARDQFCTRYEVLSKRACYNPVAITSPAPAVHNLDAVSLAALYNAYLVKVAEHNEDDWVVQGQLAFAR